MILALDTNRYVDLMRGVPEVIREIESAQELVLPFIVLAELRTGFLNGTRQRENERLLASFLNRAFVRVIYADEATVNQFAAIQVDLTRRGKTLPHNDVWIASLCLQHGLSLYTRDNHFDAIVQLKRA